ncbi:hypothetical protein CYFUS_004603 [Cystobacter fuscus]|uniref:Uncharacterized protein n=1 Tax=Cystobacter fuscus TaxID=43 RepID=A0A250J6N9_9BACT|nr:hypothetical protein CYFUS_004603 [Cystobacter fuscus]
MRHLIQMIRGRVEEAKAASTLATLIIHGLSTQ